MIVICEVLELQCKYSYKFRKYKKATSEKCENLYTPIQETNASTTGGE